MTKLKTHLKRMLAILLCIGIVLGLCGCDDKGVPTSNPEKTREFCWLICDPYSKFSGDWSQYTQLKRISEKMGIKPKVELATKEIDRTVAQALLSENMPDAITVMLTDSNFYKLSASFPLAEIEENTNLYNSIPQNIREYHCNDNGVLQYVPGGFTNEPSAISIANEGVYVLNSVYDECNLKTVTSLNELVEHLHKHNIANKENNVTDFILFGCQGFKTLEHLFGVMPSALQSVTANNYTAYSEVLAFLKKINGLGVTKSNIMNEFSKTRYPLIYIGEASAVERWNNYHGECRYVSVEVYGNQNGFLTGFSKNGSYATFIKNGENKADVTAILDQLLTKETSRSLMYGERNKDWLVDDNTDQVIIPSDTVNRMKNGDSFLISEYGLAIFPYVSSQYAAFPGFASNSLKIRDLQEEYISLCKDPTTEPYKTLFQKQQLLDSQYSSALE